MATFDINWSATISGVTGGSLGLVVGPNASGGLVAATSANIAAGCIPAGVIITTPDANGNCIVQFSGIVSASITQLGLGVASPVIIGSTGAMQRKANPTIGVDKIVGDCNANGDVTLLWGVSNLVAGSGSQLNVCTLEQFGAVGNNTSLDTAAWASAIAALNAGTYTTLLLAAGRTYNIDTGAGPFTGQFLSASNVSIIGQGQSSVFHNVGSSYILVVKNSVTVPDGFVAQNFRITGLGIGGGSGTQGGIRTGFLTNDGPNEARIINVTVSDLGGTAFCTCAINAGNGLVGPILIGCKAKNCIVGYDFSSTQSVLVGSEATGCTTGCLLGSNCTITGCDFSQNTTAFHGISGGNDGHSIISSTTCNHNTTHLQMERVSNGMTIVSCHLYQGALQTTTSGSGFSVIDLNDCIIDLTTFDNNGGFWRFTNCRFDTAYFSSASESNGGITEFINPTGVGGTLTAGSLPAWVASRWQPSVSVVNGTNNLTGTQSFADTLIIAAGGTSAGFTVKSTRTPVTGMKKQLVVNDNAQAATYVASSGSGPTIAAGASAWVGCSDGTNMRKLM